MKIEPYSQASSDRSENHTSSQTGESARIGALGVRVVSVSNLYWVSLHVSEASVCHGDLTLVVKRLEGVSGDDILDPGQAGWSRGGVVHGALEEIGRGDNTVWLIEFSHTSLPSMGLGAAGRE